MSILTGQSIIKLKFDSDEIDLLKKHINQLNLFSQANIILKNIIKKLIKSLNILKMKINILKMKLIN